MATRTCGKVKIQCTYRDASDDYRCVLSVGGKKRGVQYVGAPAHKTMPVDSPKAYSAAAHAALSFATDEGMVDAGECEHTDSGFRLRRMVRRVVRRS